MPRYEVLETDGFLSDVEETAVWILVTNIEESAEQKVKEFQSALDALAERLRGCLKSRQMQGAKGESAEAYTLYVAQANDRATPQMALFKQPLSNFPESGKAIESSELRKFPIYDGRYSAAWLVNHVKKTVTLLALNDLKYPKSLREIHFED